MSKMPRFGCDLPNALRGATLHCLDTPMTGHCDNQAEAYLLDIFTQSYCIFQGHSCDDDGQPLPLPILSEIHYQAFWAETSDQENAAMRIVNKERFHTGRRTAQILWFMDGSAILFENLAEGYAVLPISLFLSNTDRTADMMAADIETWCQAMRRMPKMLCHVDQSDIDAMTANQSIAHWANFQSSTHHDQTSELLRPLAFYAKLRHAHEFGPGRYTFAIYARRIQRDGTIGPAAVKLTGGGAQFPALQQAWEPDYLQGIADHPKFPLSPWEMVNQHAGRKYGSGHPPPHARYQSQTSIKEQPSAHEIIEAHLKAEEWLS